MPDIVDEKYGLSLSRYKDDAFEDICYEMPGLILLKLLESGVGEGLE